jgi:hypothetical protein
MDWEKYNAIPLEYKTASEIGIAAATLGAMARRGLVEVLDTKPKKYRRCDSPALRVLRLCEENKDDYGEFFVVYRRDEALGMLCSLSKSGDVLDCWGEKYDLTNAVGVSFRTRRFDI